LQIQRPHLMSPARQDIVDMSGVRGFYQALTDGTFIPQWDEEAEMRASNKNWYKQALLKVAAPPYISEVRPVIDTVGATIKALPNVLAVYVFGSFVNVKTPSYYMKDLDIVAEVDFYIGDMQGCTTGDEFGFDDEECQEARDFTDQFTSMFSMFNMDPWIITGDGELLHWGPLVDSDDQFDELKEMAYETAYNVTSISPGDYGFDNDDLEGLDEEKIDAIEDEDIREKIREFMEVYEKDLSDYVDMGMREGAHGWYSFGPSLTADDIRENGVRIA